MVIDINLLRADRGHDPNIVLISEQNRFKGTARAEKVMELDKTWRNLRFQLDTLNRNKNMCLKIRHLKTKNKQENGENVTFEDLLKLSKDIMEKMGVEQLATLATDISNKITQAESDFNSIEEERNRELNEIGNLLHPSVVISNNEDDNNIIRTYGDCHIKMPLSHVDLLLMIDGADYKRGSIIAGNRGYFLKGPGVFLAQALIQYSLRKLNDKGYVCLYTPFFMKKSIMQEVAQLSQFDDELYKVFTKNSDSKEDGEEEKYLIATSEQTIAAYHRNEWLSPKDLPIKYAGISTCFRQEVGSHGRDTTGIFRVHQFEKVEQFVICSPKDDESWKLFDEMIQNSEDLCKDLGIGYRVVGIVSGALNNAAAKKYDLESWFPGSKAFRELVSCSNCTDYQSRRLAIRFGQTKKMNQDTEYVHMLNSTMCAVTRLLCCLLETHQTETGINVPACLHPYLPPSMKFIPFSSKAK